MKLDLFIAFFGAIFLAVLRSELCINLGLFQLDMAIEKLPMFFLGMIVVEKKLPRENISIPIGFLMFLVFGVVQKIGDIHLVDNIVRFLLPASIVFTIVQISHIVYPMAKKFNTLAFILKQSFGIYLFHMTFIYLMRHIGCDEWPLIVSIPTTFVSALLASCLVTMVVRRTPLRIMIGE